MLHKAVEIGLMTAEDAANMTPQAAQRLIFALGSSIAKDAVRR